MNENIYKNPLILKRDRYIYYKSIDNKKYESHLITLMEKTGCFQLVLFESTPNKEK